MVAVSGGPDSLALLDLLIATRAEHGLELIVAHADHGIHPDSAKVAANSVVRLPFNAGNSYSADAPGVERVKAILFTSRENAQALVGAFPQEGVEPRKMRRITESASPRQSFFTFGRTFGVE